uniref:Uncharacterized protein n=1 Tax=Candidatus Kentrum sp. TUN TaxID=2126343 RepID=A0A450ZD59_9GAMM|nr:MAG: hypothetical protein BECKTUN1418D_GA0071000_101026 [Candidatus Kentron sp. TUN]VFK59843.1 MAG: hypothetical protein BECKTUN1418F_GA0071002_11894 [Candidatus Kentron sp. TUN]VFK68679.1 MAG: hypothetical protein BECKTUN1418E_GA0071001_11873 [Candidatus Kentron sp. TUN]
MAIVYSPSLWAAISATLSIKNTPCATFPHRHDRFIETHNQLKIVDSEKGAYFVYFPQCTIQHHASKIQEVASLENDKGFIKMIPVTYSNRDQLDCPQPSMKRWERVK